MKCGVEFGSNSFGNKPFAGAFRKMQYLKTPECSDNFMACKDTSSTAQGGGGCFKDRKPIGEVGCGESWMAERIHWLQ